MQIAELSPSFEALAMDKRILGNPHQNIRLEVYFEGNNIRLERQGRILSTGEN